MPVPNYDRSTSAEGMVYDTSNIGYSATVSLGFQQVLREILQVSSVKTPGYGKLKAYQLPWNPYSKWDYRVTSPRGSVTTTRRMYNPAPTGTVQYYTRRVCTLTSLSAACDPGNDAYQVGTFADDPYPLAVSRLTKLMSEGNASTGVFLAESGKTAAHLAHTATRVYNALRALKKCRFGEFTSALGITVTENRVSKYYTNMRVYHGQKGSGFAYDSRSKFSREQQQGRFSDFAAKTWLEYAYGWKPLLKDVYDHAVALENVANTYGLVMRRAISSAKTSKTTVKNFLVLSDLVRFNKNVVSNNSLRLCVEFRLPTGVVGVTRAFGLTDPLSVAWEVIPFSFVVDWFYPIGNFLESIASYNNLVFHRGYKIVLNTYSGSNKGSPGPYKPNWAGDSTLTIDGVSLTSKIESFSFVRSNLTSFPTVPYPKLKDPRSIAHGISAVALLKTLFIPTKAGASRL